MALLLALETATAAVSAALLQGEEVLAESAAEPTAPAAESVLPAVDAVLRRAGAGLADVAAFGLSIGPGSFTGLRVGLATVKGLAHGGDRPVVPVSTLAALAATAAGDPAPVAALLDARRGELYAGVFDVRPAVPEVTVAEGVYAPAELAAKLPAGCRLVGEDAALRELAGVGLAATLPHSAVRPFAGAVGLLAARVLARGGATTAAAVVPRYLRRAEAEVRRTGRRFESTRGG